MSNDAPISKLAIASLALAIFGIMIPECSYLSVVCAIIYQAQNKKRKEPLLGNKLANIAGIASTVLIFVRIFLNNANSYHQILQ